MGGKFRLKGDLVPILENSILELGGDYYEPFVGGGWIVSNITPSICKRFASDNNPYLIALYKAVQQGWEGPNHISEEEYIHIKNNKSDYPPELVAFAGFGCSFGKKWFGTYARDGSTYKQVNYADRLKRGLAKRKHLIEGVEFRCVNYYDLEIPPNSTIYCDPPYKGVTGYSGSGSKFNHEDFYDWCCSFSNDINIFISEYDMPDDRFDCVFEKNQNVRLNNQTKITHKVERLFIPKR